MLRSYPNLLLGIILILPVLASAANLYRDIHLGSTSMEAGSNIHARATQSATCDIGLTYIEQYEADIQLYGWPKDSDGTNDGLKPILDRNLIQAKVTSYRSINLGPDRARIIFTFLAKDGNGTPIRPPQTLIESSITTYSGSANIQVVSQLPGL